MLDHVRRHLVNRAIEPGHVGRREAHGGGRLADDGQRGRQVPRLGEEGEPGDLLLRRLVGFHARGSHLRRPRVQSGGLPTSGCASAGVGATVPSMSPTSTSPLPPQETLTFVQKKWQDDVLPTLTRYIEIPAKSPSFDANWAANGHIERAVGADRGLGPASAHRGPDRRDVPDPGAHAGDAARRARHLGRDRPALRTLRQAAGDGGLGRRARPLEGRAPRRSALRPRRPGRRVRGVLRPHRDRGRAARGRAARALPGPDRGERGERQSRPARLHGAVRLSHRRAGPRDLSRLRLR